VVFVKNLNTVAYWLIIVGALNWGLIGIFKWDLVANLLGGGDMLAVIPRIVYTLVGLAALVAIFNTSEK